MPDPADPQSLNRYSYVRNTPLSLTDPTGHTDVYMQANVPVYRLPSGFTPYQFTYGFTQNAQGLSTTVAVTQGPSLWNAYVRAVRNRIQSLNGQGADPDFINGEYRRYIGDDLFPSDLGANERSSLTNYGLPPNHFINRGASPALPATTAPTPQATSSGGASALATFALGFIPGYDLGQAIGSPDAGFGDYFLGVLGVIPGGKGAKVGFEGIFDAVRHLLTPGSSKGIFTFHGGQAGLESLFLEVGQHGRLIDHPTLKGLFVDLGQGANVTMRDSAKYGPTMDVKIPGIDIQKIHLPK